MNRTATRNNILAGTFLIGAAVLAIVMSVIISDAQKRLVPTSPYTIRFSLADGATGIKLESPVTLGGQSVGRVTGIDFERGPTGEPTGVAVGVRVREDVQLHEDAFVFLIQPLLGSMSSINIADIGGRPAENGKVAGVLASGGTLTGQIAPPAFLAQAGWGPEQARQMRSMFESAERTVKNAEEMLDRIDAELEPMLAQIRGTVDDAKDITGQFRTKTPEWTGQVDTILASVNDAAAKAPQIMDDAQSRISEVRAAIEENRPRVDRIVQNVEQITERLNTESMPLVQETLASVRDGASEFKEVGEQVGSALERELPSLSRTIANARLASDQLKLTTIEVRRNPWRLLYQPGTKELENELLYDAARTYAEAVSDLRAASETLRLVALNAEPATPGAAAGGTTFDAAEVEAIRAQLEAAFRKYSAAEQNLLQMMIDRR